jgi:hypothetical protein
MTRTSITAIYCDDIRNEVGGKISFMGVCGADLFLPTFPITLSKLCVFVTVKFPLEQYPKEHVKIVVLEGDDQISSTEIDKLSLEQNRPIQMKWDQQSDTDSTSDERNFALSVAFTLSPLNIKAPTYLKVRAYIDGEEIKGNSLKVGYPNEPETS